ncbi:MAG TPA: tRNA pseudouridine(13) synthase TruD [Anaeromyxobacteraceae bacterium]|nr:tRNA pseudouridine(13) synthase TruD [Anaeromyxobacteraceae bacterium]
MKLKQLPEDFSVTESWRFDPDPRGEWNVYLMDKQKLSTFEAVERLRAAAGIAAADVSYCGLKDKQGRTTQLVAVRGARVEMQEPDLRLKPLGRTAAPLSAANTTSNRFAVTVRDLSEEDVARLPESVAEVRRIGVVDYFDSQRFGSLKHGQGFLVKELMRGEHELALKNFLAHPSTLDRSDDARVKQFWKENWGHWERRNPFPGADRYEIVVRWLRKHPGDFLGAFLRTEPRWRALQVFAYQSWLWNEGVKAWLRDVVGVQRLVSIRYQAGTLLFPRELDPALARSLRDLTFPLLAPGTRFTDPRIERAALSVLAREGQTLADLRVKDAPQIHFDPEERPLLVSPGKLVVGEARQDELNRGRLRVNHAITLPPGAYATLVVKRLFWWTLQPGASRPARKPPAPPPKPPTPEERAEERRRTGFLAAKRARREARKKRSALPK